MPKNSPDLPFGQYRFSLSDPKDTEDIMTVCHALSSQERLTILRMLYAESMSITKIARAIGISVSTACFHVRTLREAGLVNVTTMQGKHIWSRMRVFAQQMNRSCSRTATFLRRAVQTHRYCGRVAATWSTAYPTRGGTARSGALRSRLKSAPKPSITASDGKATSRSG